MAVTALDVRDIALQLPRAYEAWVRDYRKFRVGQIVFASVSPDETQLGFGFPREERADLVASEPDKFFLPRPSDLRYQWVCAWLAALDRDEAVQQEVRNAARALVQAVEDLRAGRLSAPGQDLQRPRPK